MRSNCIENLKGGIKRKEIKSGIFFWKERKFVREEKKSNVLRTRKTKEERGKNCKRGFFFFFEICKKKKNVDDWKESGMMERIKENWKLFFFNEGESRKEINEKKMEREIVGGEWEMQLERKKKNASFFYENLNKKKGKETNEKKWKGRLEEVRESFNWKAVNKKMQVFFPHI